MGLTIHYSIKAPENWGTIRIREMLGNTRHFASTLRPLGIDEGLTELHGKECDWSNFDSNEPHRWLKIQSARHLETPWRPGCSLAQPADRILAFTMMPAPGSEPMNVGICRYKKHVFKPAKKLPDYGNYDQLPCWNLVVDEPDRYPESTKIFRDFQRRWKLRKMQEKPRDWSVFSAYGSPDSLVQFLRMRVYAGIYPGRYLSHRKGRQNPLGIFVYEDRFGFHRFRYHGKPQEAEQAFRSEAFREDVEGLLLGKEFQIPAETGWCSFCKTQYANDPECGGVANFLKAHLSVIAVLDHLKALGFEVEVSDEGDFWEKRDVPALIREIGAWDGMIAAFAGLLKDQLGNQVESPILGRPDFERSELKGQLQLGDRVDVIKNLVVTLDKYIKEQANVGCGTAKEAG